jgi:hypothetical protein
MLQEFAQFFERYGAFPSHQDFERRADAGRVAGAQRLPDRSRGQRQGVAAQVFGQHDAGQQVGLDGQREELLDLVLASGQQHPPAGRKPYFLIAVLQGFQQQAARHPPAGLVHARVGEAGEGHGGGSRRHSGPPRTTAAPARGPAPDRTAGRERCLPPWSETAESIPRYRRRGSGCDAGRPNRPCRRPGIPPVRPVARDGSRRKQPAARAARPRGASPPIAAPTEGAHQANRRVERASGHQRCRRPGHRRISRLSRATSSMGLKGFTT